MKKRTTTFKRELLIIRDQSLSCQKAIQNKILPIINCLSRYSCFIACSVIPDYTDRKAITHNIEPRFLRKGKMGSCAGDFCF
jgi:hypothetical protein